MQTAPHPTEAPGPQLLPEIPCPELMPRREYSLYLARAVRSRAGRVRAHVVRVVAWLVAIHPRHDGQDYEFLIFSSDRPELLPAGRTLYLGRRLGEMRPKEWRASEIDN